MADIVNISSNFIFKENHIFIEEENNSSKNFILVDKELDGIRGFQILLRLVFIYVKCGNLKVVVDGGELNRNINQKKKSDFPQSPL